MKDERLRERLSEGGQTAIKVLLKHFGSEWETALFSTSGVSGPTCSSLSWSLYPKLLDFILTQDTKTHILSCGVI